MMVLDAPWLRPDNTTGKYAALVLAAIVHLALAAFLFYGVRWQTQAGDVVEVELVRAASPPRAVVAVPPAPTFRPAPVVEEKPAPTPPRPDIAIKEPKPKAQPKEEPPQETFKEKLKARTDSFLDQLKHETERLVQRKNTDAIATDLAKEQAAREAAARDKGMADYLSRIRGKIRGNIVLPPEVKGNPEAVFEVTQLPSGEIITARLKQSSGNQALDAAIERAILKSNPLPKPDKSDLFSRSLELRFRPLDE
jgi:colicin import membrane protein